MDSEFNMLGPQMLSVAIIIIGLIAFFAGIIGIKIETVTLASTINAAFKLAATVTFFLAAPIMFCLILLFAIIINMLIFRISGLICILYLYIYSYFGAEIRSSFSKNSLNKMFRNLGDKNPCKDTFSDPLMDLVNKAIEFIYNNLTMVIIMCYCARSIHVYLSRMFNKRAAGFLIGANVFIIVIAIVVCIFNTVSKTDLRDYNYIEPYNT